MSEYAGVNKQCDIQTELGKDAEARLVMKDDFKPIMMKAGSLPYAFRDKVERELEAMAQWLKAEYFLR